MKKIFVLTITAVILSATQSMATQPAFPGQADSVYIGVFFPRTSFEGDIKGVDTGDGVGGRIGFSVENVLSSEFSAFKSWHDAGPAERIALSGITLDIKLSLPLFPVVSPYGFVGMGRYTLETPQTVYRGDTDGNGINGYQDGLGLDLYLSKNFSLNLGYTTRRMKFDTGTPGGTTLKTTAKTYDIGLAVHFY
jgi:opacity protein-like surface antigen